MTYSTRQFEDRDAPALTSLTFSAIQQLVRRHYSPSQVAAWASSAPIPERFIERIAKGDLIWVTCDSHGQAVAYVLLEPDGHLDLLYCHPEHSGKIIASRLLITVENYARATGLTRLYAEASELARPVFARAGFMLLHRRDFTIGPATAPVAIHNYAMEKRLT